ncbi:cytochrome P450 [Agrocybe pediades]|nr:cytochrome P450 [Agrocybe pediades]
MEGNDSKRVLVTTLATSIATHVWFKSFDPISLQASLAVLSITPTVLACYLSSVQNVAPLSDLLWIYPTYYLAVLLSVCAYRLSPFHPLAKYPGPTILKITKLYSVWVAYKGTYHAYIRELHRRYGPTIRTGPNELSTLEKGLIPLILGSQGMPRGPIWDGRRFAQGGNSQYDSVIDVRDASIHAQVRRPWNKALGAEPIKDYESLLIERVTQLRDLLKAKCDETRDKIGKVDISQWISYFSFDFMGDLAFAGAVNYMKEGPGDGGMDAMNNAMFLISITQHAPWISKLIRATPILNRGMKNFIAYGIGRGVTRASAQIKHKDLFHHMTEAEEVTGPDSIPLIISNVLLAIVAGSDTTASVLSNAAYLLMSHPEKHRKLQREIDAAFREYQMLEFDPLRTYDEMLSKLPYLNAVLNETLRLFPAVPTTIQRAPSKGTRGKMLQAENVSIFLPEGNGIMVPPYTLHRDPRYFSPSPDSFIPERWLPATDGTEYITSRDAFIPFSVGPANCAGRALALVELRYVVATLVRHFEMEFDIPAFKPERWEKELEDRFTFSKGALGTRLKWRG